MLKSNFNMSNTCWNTNFMQSNTLTTCWADASSACPTTCLLLRHVQISVFCHGGITHDLLLKINFHAVQLLSHYHCVHSVQLFLYLSCIRYRNPTTCRHTSNYCASHSPTLSSSTFWRLLGRENPNKPHFTHVLWFQLPKLGLRFDPTTCWADASSTCPTTSLLLRPVQLLLKYQFHAVQLLSHYHRVHSVQLFLYLSCIRYRNPTP